MLEIEDRRARSREVEFGSIFRFIDASQEIRFSREGSEQVDGWMERVLVELEYAQQGRSAHGLVRRYVFERLLPQALSFSALRI